MPTTHGHRANTRTGRPWRRITAQLKATCRVCWLCGHPIDVALPRNHPHAFTVDHVIPLSRGGPNTIDNARAAHRRCNSQRGNRADYKPTMRTSRTW